MEEKKTGDDAEASAQSLAPDTEPMGEEPLAEEGPAEEELPEATSSAPAEEETAEEPPEEASEISRAHLRGLLEALVFASDKPLKAGELARLASARVKDVRELLEELKTEYEPRGVVLSEVAGGWLFRTSARYAPFVRDLAGEKPVRLTRAQIETLAIAAYRQPITRPEIDEIRGVDSGATLKLLLERDLLRILGKKDEPGRPLLYGTTGQFLEFFGLKSLKDLPTLKEFTELTEESRLVAEAELGEVLPGEGAPAPHPAPPHDAGEIEEAESVSPSPAPAAEGQDGGEPQEATDAPPPPPPEE
jgi:segregation and condensation protein B